MNKIINKKLYNMNLPVFLLFGFMPILWMFLVIENFILDSIILIAILIVVYKKIKFKLYIKMIFKIWLWGIFSNIVGIVYLILTSFISNATYYEGNNIIKLISSGIYLATNQSHFDSIWATLYIISGIFISSIFLFVLNYFFTFYNMNLTKRQKILSSLSFAVLTPPYFILLPKDFFGFFI